MNNIISANTGILFMKVGVHAQESLENIIARKVKEIEEAGFAMWGYGGNTCHPRTMVQPFAQDHENKGNPIFLYMQKINSQHFAEPLRAEQFSVDGQNWEKVPAGINVLGSRFALVLESLSKEELSLPLHSTQVAIGPSRGRRGEQYIQGHVDKACLEVVEPLQAQDEQGSVIKISLVAKLKPPYAVFLRA